MQLKELYTLGKENLSRNAIETPALEAYLLLSELDVVNNMSEIYSKPDKEVGQDCINKFKHLMQRRVKREPIAYIMGVKEFYSKSYKVNSGVLIPRPETELLVDETLKLAQRVESPSILEIGTGSGCISVTIASYIDNANIVASDISQQALNVANENIAYHNKKDTISLLRSDLVNSFQSKSFDIIVSNPPYIPDNEFCKLETGVKNFEPKIALSGGENGLKYIKEIISDSKRVLKNEGWCVLEIGKGQASSVEKLFEESGFIDISTKKDLNNIERVIRAKWKK